MLPDRTPAAHLHIPIDTAGMPYPLQGRGILLDFSLCTLDSLKRSFEGVFLCPEDSFQ
jgi:hypothetical protein